MSGKEKELTVIDFEEFVNEFGRESGEMDRSGDMDAYNIVFFDFCGKAEVQDLIEFNGALINERLDDGAQWLSEEEFVTVFNYMLRFNKTYKSRTCELRISVTPVMDDAYQQESERILTEFGTILRNSLRRSDIIMQKENDFYLLLPDLSEQNKISVLGRIRRNLIKEGLYSIVKMRADAMMIEPDRMYETWYRVAI